jgi:cytochrome b involved in lipid metabolism
MSEPFVVPHEEALALQKQHVQQKYANRDANNHAGERSSLMTWRRALMQQQPQEAASQRVVTEAEVAAHAGRDGAGCWVVIHNVVYDVAMFLNHHPGGGDVLLRYAGRDVTSLFDAFHAHVNHANMLRNCVVGTLKR